MSQSYLGTQNKLLLHWGLISRLVKAMLALSKQVKNQLQEIHRQCRHQDPSERPSASALLKTYKIILKKLELKHFGKNRWHQLDNSSDTSMRCVWLPSTYPKTVAVFYSPLQVHLWKFCNCIFCHSYSIMYCVLKILSSFNNPRRHTSRKCQRLVISFLLKTHWLFTSQSIKTDVSTHL